MEKPNNSKLVKEKLQKGNPVVIAVSGPSGAGKDYLTTRAIEHFSSEEIPVFNAQMTTERPHRGEAETKICITSEEYDKLQEEGALIGDHVNKVRYGYKKRDIEEAIDKAKKEGGMVIVELNPAKQGDFPEELKSHLGIDLTAWIGVETTPEQTEENMRERGESEKTIKARVELINEFIEAMEESDEITLVDNGPDNRENSPQDFINIIYSSILQRG